MYIFIDESGIHKQSGLSSVVLVYIGVENIHNFNAAVEQIEKDLGIHAFHWTDQSWDFRKNFITALAKLDFTFKVALFENPFYATTSYEYVLRHLIVEKNINSVVIDGKKGRVYEHKLTKILRQKGVAARKVITGNDEGYPALRAADALAAVIRRFENDRENKYASDIYNKIKKKISIIIRK